MLKFYEGYATKSYLMSYGSFITNISGIKEVHYVDKKGFIIGNEEIGTCGLCVMNRVSIEFKKGAYSGFILTIGICSHVSVEEPILYA